MDVKSDGAVALKQDNEVAKSLRSDSGISLENVENQENLNKYNECEKKMDDEILANLLKNVQKSLPSSGCSSEDELESEGFSSKSKVDFKSLIEGLSSCKEMNNNKDPEMKKEDRKEEGDKSKKKSGSKISDINDIFNANKKKTDARVSNKTDTPKHRDKKSLVGTEKLSSAAIMEQLSAKISSMNLAKQEKLKSRDKTVKPKKEEEKKKPDNEADEQTEKHKKKEKKYSIFLERGPWSKQKTHGVRNDNPFYQKNHQLINTNILSGGKCWAAEEPIDFIPKTIPDFEGLLSKSLEEDSTLPTSNAPENNDALDDTLSPTAIAAVLEKEVLCFTNGDNLTLDNVEEPNWGDYELVKNILEREAGSIDVTREVHDPTPTIVVNECVNQALDCLPIDNQVIVGDEDLNDQCFVIQSPASDTPHEVSYACQRIDQLTPTSQTNTFTFDNRIVTNEINSLPQNFELPPTPTDLRSPIQLYSPADCSLSLKVPPISSNFYSPSPSIYSVNNGSPEQTFLTESPRYSKTPNLDQEFLGINNALLNQTAFSDTFPNHMSSPNDSYLRSSTRSNRSSFCGSDYFSDQCFSSPNAECSESQSYDNIYELSSPTQCRRTKESFNSNSPLESPEIFLNPEELDSISFVLSHSIQQEQIIQSHQNNSSEICLQLYSAQNQTRDGVQVLKQNAKPVYFIDSNTQNNGTIQPTHQNPPSIQRLEQKSAKNSKVKPIPIAAKQSYPCCVKPNKSAREILEEMFQRLDENMQSNVLLKVHTLDDNNLMKLLDSLLAGWGCAKLSIPRLPLLYAICERLLMTKTTMIKFFKTYGNGHTVLDRALLTCSQSPILTKYIAECTIKAMGCLQKDRDIMMDKTDSGGNSVLHRAICAGVDCATPLAYLLQLNVDGSLLDVNRLNSEGYSPLHLACSIHVQQTGGLVCSCLVMTHILLEHGNSDPNIKDRKSGITALHTAVNSNGCSPALVSLLLKYGADPSIRNYYSSTALDLAKSACRSSNNLQCAKQVVDILKKFKH